MNKNTPLKKERIGVFIDGSNFYFGLKRNNRPTRVDYFKLCTALAGPDRELVRIYYYNSAYDPDLSPEQAKGQQSFFDSLDKTPFLELRLGRISLSLDGSTKVKGVATRLASDLIFYAALGGFDTAIVLTDDSEYAPVLAQVKELGRQMEIGLFADSQSRDLIQAADNIIHLEGVLDKKGTNICPSTPEPEKDDSETSLVGSNRVTVAETRKKYLAPPKVFRLKD